MSYSKTHQRLSDKLKNPKVLTNPEPFLGPNWETVLRWWLYYDSLTFEQRIELNHRWCAIDDDTRNRARALTEAAATKVIGWYNRLEVCYVTLYPSITYELIALHKLEKPFFLPLVVPEFDHKQN
jgi:hypothetical protein